MTIPVYKKKLWTYEKRRKIHYDSLQRLNKSIGNMRWRLKIKEAAERKMVSRIENLITVVNYFFSVDIKSNKWDKKHRLARFIFYKIAVESQMKNTLVCKAVHKNRKAASYGRDVLTKSFKTNPENKELFHKFKKFYLENKIL